MTHDQLMAQLNDPKTSRDDHVVSYARGLQRGQGIRWATVDEALLGRWGTRSLRYIKQRSRRVKL
jgi:hypothetical protein